MDLNKLRRETEERDTPDAERRDLLKAATLVGGAAALFGAMTQTASAQTTPVAAMMPALTEKPWWPHPRWGKDDQAGASNWITPAKVLDAIKTVKDGKIYRVGRVYDSKMPKYGERTFNIRITPVTASYGANRLVGHDEFIATEIGQTGTQFDGLGHIGIQMGKDGDLQEVRFYNGVTEFEMTSPYGLQKLGIENCKPIFTRGHLFDIEAVKGKMMEVGEEIKLADVRAAMQKQGMKEEDIKDGDALFFNTGWGVLWNKNNDKYNSGEPGIGLEVAHWLIGKNPCMMGSDCWATEVVPNPDKNLVFPVHSEVITKHGIYNHENLDFTSMIADKKYQFLYVFSPAPIRGATGSNGGPIAVT